MNKGFMSQKVLFYPTNIFSFSFQNLQVQFQSEADEKWQYFCTLGNEGYGQDDDFFSLNEYYAFLQRAPKEKINPLCWSVFAYLSLLVFKEHCMMKYLMIDCVSCMNKHAWEGKLYSRKFARCKKWLI